jgi:hypothetical protein
MLKCWIAQKGFEDSLIVKKPEKGVCRSFVQSLLQGFRYNQIFLRVKTMRISVVLALAFVIIGGCAANRCSLRECCTYEFLTIRWQRLVDDDGQTCQRCGLTEKEVEQAYQSLKQSLAPLGIQVALEEKILDSETCAQDISQSNRIWVGKRPLEEWLDAEVGQSHCGSCCGELGQNVECRTVEVDGKIYEVIPSEFIIKAGLLAATELLDGQLSEPCCKGKCSAEENCCGNCSNSDCNPAKCE